MNKPLLSVIVTCHAEGIILHHTLRSVYRCLSLFESTAVNEVIVHIDSPTQAMSDYIPTMVKDFPEVIVLQNSFGDPGLSRNFAVKRAEGKYVAIIDGDDIMSRHWLRRAVDTLEASTEPTVAHSELTLEFEGADSVVKKHPGADPATNTLLSVYSNRWNAIFVLPRELLLKTPYSASGSGYGFEDWHINNSLIAAGAKHILIPETAIFVRRKKFNSVWLSQKQTMSVLRANPLLSFAHIRSIDNVFLSYIPTDTARQTLPVRQQIKRYVKQHKALHFVARKTKSLVYDYVLPRVRMSPKKHLPEWLISEWRDAHTVERQLYPSRDTIHGLQFFDSLTENHKVAGALYKVLIDNLKYDSYDYILLTPWLNAGGADKFVINYANAIASARPDKRVLVVATTNIRSTWHTRLHEGVDFLEFGAIIGDTPSDIAHKLMSHLVENAGISHIHIVNSEFGYNFVQTYSSYVGATKKVVATSFSQSIKQDGQLYGYSHTHMPFIYDLATLITTDNNAVVTMWQNEYGFNPEKVRVHRLPVDLTHTIQHKAEVSHLRVLWAARLSPEKLAHLVPAIASQLKDTKIIIDMYGTPDKDYSTSFLQSLPNNVTYRGKFSDFFTDIPLDQYDAYLYTSLFDGMPNALLEASEAGLPIVASAVGGVPEFIDDKNGILVEDIFNVDAYAAALKQLADNPERRTELANNAYKTIEMDFSAKQYTASIDEMLDYLEY